MKDKKFIEIKNRIYKSCLEIWGIEDVSMADPIVMMLLEVVIYEIYYLNQEIIDSDSKIIERVAQEVISSQWSLPMPAHAFASSKTNSGIVVLNDKTEFSIKNNENRNTSTAIYFTPFTEEKIIEGSIVFQYHNIFLSHPNGVEALNANHKIADYKIWIGLDCNETIIHNLQTLKITFLTENSNLDQFLKFVEVKDALGNVVAIQNEDYAEIEDNKHYTENIKTYYQNFVYKLSLQPENIVYNTILDQFKIEKEAIKCDEAKLKVIWFEFTFPEIFTKEELDKITIKINTFPVINRKLNQKTHHLKNEGRLFSMKGNNYSHFLNVDKISDQNNSEFKDSLKYTLNDTQNKTYTLFYGGLENYDPRNAKFFLKKLTRVLREDISAFSSINADYIDSTMAKINEEITNIEQKINISFSDINDKEDVFALINIVNDIEMIYCTYWTSEGSLANNFKKGTVLKQAILSELIQDETVLETTSTGGVFRTDKAEKLINMRYGFLSKERLVTTQDIKAAIQFYLRNTTKEITIKDGVGISTLKKKGLYRTIDVTISLLENTLLEANSKKKMELFLKETLEKQSVMNIPFQITIN
jgi:hypothetical protein